MVSQEAVKAVRSILRERVQQALRVWLREISKEIHWIFAGKDELYGAEELVESAVPRKSTHR